MNLGKRTFPEEVEALRAELQRTKPDWMYQERRFMLEWEYTWLHPAAFCVWINENFADPDRFIGHYNFREGWGQDDNYFHAFWKSPTETETKKGDDVEMTVVRRYKPITLADC